MFYLTPILQLPTGSSKYAKKDATTWSTQTFSYWKIKAVRQMIIIAEGSYDYYYYANCSL